MKKKWIRALGIMNGTSIDAIDYTLIEIHRETKIPRFIGHQQKKIPAAMKADLLQAATNSMTTFDLSHLHFDLGRLYQKLSLIHI